MYRVYPLIGEYLDGTTASGLYEARLGYEEMGKENHIFSPAYKEEEMPEILRMCDHIIFNSPAQFRRYIGYRSGSMQLKPDVKRAWVCASIQSVPLRMDMLSMIPARRIPGWELLWRDSSRIWQRMRSWDLDGLHFHTLCEQDADALETTLKIVEEKFGRWLSQMKWVNFGGGHHVTREGYDLELLKKCIRHVSETYGVEVYLEPGRSCSP